jgi:hypothetical protein
MALFILRVAQGHEAEAIEPEWIQPIVMTACCAGLLVAALAVLVLGI